MDIDFPAGYPVGLVLLPISYLVVIFLLPLAWLFLMSFYRAAPMGFFVRQFSLDNYGRLLLDGFYLKVLLRTVGIGILSALLSLIVGFPLALLITNSTPRTRLTLTAIVLLPVLVSIVIRSYGWMVLLTRDGLLNQGLMTIRIVNEPVRLLSDVRGVVIALTSFGLPYMVLSLLGPMQNIRMPLVESARMLGASDIQVLRLVVLPLSKPGILAGSSLVYALSAAAFVTPSLVGGGRVLTIPLLAFQQAVQLLNWPFAAAMVFALLLSSVCVLFLGIRLGQLENVRLY